MRKKPDVDLWLTLTCIHAHTHEHTHTHNTTTTVSHTPCIRLLAWMDTALGRVWRDMVDLGTLGLSKQDLPVATAAGGMGNQPLGHPPGHLGGR